MTTRDTEAWIQRALAATDVHHFVVIKDGAVIGSTSYLNVFPEHLRLEIGHTWNTPAAWGTGANTDAKYLLLRHAFETLGARRVEFKTDAKNDRARAALAAIPSRVRGDPPQAHDRPRRRAPRLGLVRRDRRRLAAT